MPKVTILADDLTGAADCGIAFEVAGLSTFVSTGDVSAVPPVQVVSVDLDTRHRAAAEAVQRSQSAAAAAWRGGARILYRKIDSTLRGNVGVEVAATARAILECGARPAPLVVAAPAFPGTGRVTVGGRVLVAGVPLEETEVWRGAGMTGPADLAGMFSAAGLPTANVALGAVRSGPEALGRELAAAAGKAPRAVVCDAETEDDLRAIAEAGSRLEIPVVWCGSAGLARHLPAALRLAGEHRPAAGADREGAILVLVGSRSQVARQQAQRLAAEPGMDRVEIAPEALLAGAGEAVRDHSARVGALLARGRDVLVLTGLARLVEPSRGLEMAAALGRLAADQARLLRGVAATGGDVARALLDALGARGLLLRGEVEPGVPLGTTDTEPSLRVVTKAGAFGTPDTLLRCRDALRSHS